MNRGLTNAGHKELMLLMETRATKEETGNTQNIVNALGTYSVMDTFTINAEKSHQTAEFTTQSFNICAR